MLEKLDHQSAMNIWAVTEAAIHVAGIAKTAGGIAETEAVAGCVELEVEEEAPADMAEAALDFGLRRSRLLG
jgi:hypothetical protein